MNANNNNMFSALDENMNIETHIIKESSQQVKSRGKSEPIKFVLATSYIDSRKHHTRTQGFSKMQDKETLAQTLTCTKACHHVLRKIDEETGEISEEYGVCYREVCSFAHSIAELQLAECAFGDDCNRRYGFKDFKTGKTDQTRKCQFVHPGESHDEFYRRTGREKPDLPLTSEKSRCPKPSTKEQSNKDEPKKHQGEKPICQEDLSKIMTKMLKTVEVKEPQGQWSKPIDKSKIEAPPVTQNNSCPEDKTIVIRVPKELAGQALEMALLRGLTDFKIETF